MLGRQYVLVAVLFSIAVEPTIGAGPLNRRRACRPACTTCENIVCGDPRPAECYCLQHKQFELGDLDLYACQYYPDGCGDDLTVEHYSDVWYGTASLPPAQACVDGNCVGCSAKHMSITEMPGHDFTIASKTEAEEKLKGLITGAGLNVNSIPEFEYYKVPKNKTCGCPGAMGDVYVVIFRVTPEPKPSPAGALYLGIQVPELPGVPVKHKLDNDNCERAKQCPIGGKLMRVNFTVPPSPTGESRSAIVWLMK